MAAQYAESERQDRMIREKVKYFADCVLGRRLKIQVNIPADQTQSNGDQYAYGEFGGSLHSRSIARFRHKLHPRKARGLTLELTGGSQLIQGGHVKIDKSQQVRVINSGL